MRPHMFIAAGLLLVAVPIVPVSAQESSKPGTVHFETPMYFTLSDGNRTAIEPGTYHVEALAEMQLKLTGDETGTAMVVQSMNAPHDLDITAPVTLLVPVDEDTQHLILLLPNHQRREAVGSMSEIRSRAPLAPISSAQVSQAIANTPLSSGQMTTQGGVIGRPSPPVLISPAAQTRLAQKYIEFRWSPGIGGPTPTSFQLCIAEAGQLCSMVDGPSTTSRIIANLAPKSLGYKLQISDVRNLLFPYQGERALTWTVAACAPSPINPTVGQTSPAICRYASPRPLFWKPVPDTPRLADSLALHEPQMVNDRPQLSVYAVQDTHHYLFCISSELRSGGPPAAGCWQGSVVVNTGTQTSTTGWEWGSSPISSPTGSPAAIAGINALWSAAACFDDTNCSWSVPGGVIILPTPTLTAPLNYTYSDSPQHRFFWTTPSQPYRPITHYRLCFATQGSRLVNSPSTLLDIPGMLRDLCSDDIPPGNQPAYRKPVPSNLASACPSSGCRMPEPIATIYTTQPNWTIDLREHLDWSRYANQPIVWTAAACHGSNRNCMWQTSQYGSITFPSASQAPRSVNGTLGTAVRISWSPVVGNDYYIPCLREATANCANGNLLDNPRMNTIGYFPNDHPSSCTLQGRYPAGPKVIEIAGCNDIWGCRWKLYQTVTLGTNQEPHASNPRLECQ